MSIVIKYEKSTEIVKDAEKVIKKIDDFGEKLEKQLNGLFDLCDNFKI